MKKATTLHNPTGEGDEEGNQLCGTSVDRQQQAAQAAVVKPRNVRARLPSCRGADGSVSYKLAMERL